MSMSKMAHTIPVPSDPNEDTATKAARLTGSVRRLYEAVTRQKLKREFIVQMREHGVGTRGVESLLKTLAVGGGWLGVWVVYSENNATLSEDGMRFSDMSSVS